MSTKILDLLAQLELQIDESPRPKIGGNTKRIVDTEQLSDLFSDLRVTIPDEIRWAQSVLAEKEETLATARREAEEIVREAKEQREKLLNESSITEEAENRARDMILKARTNADIITDGARRYTDDILVDLQRYLGEYIDIIEKNRGELSDAYPDNRAQENAEEEYPDSGDEDEFVSEDEGIAAAEGLEDGATAE